MHTWFHVLSDQKILKGIYYVLLDKAGCFYERNSDPTGVLEEFCFRLLLWEDSDDKKIREQCYIVLYSELTLTASEFFEELRKNSEIIWFLQQTASAFSNKLIICSVTYSHSRRL